MKNRKVAIYVSICLIFSTADGLADTGKYAEEPRYEKLGSQSGQSLHFSKDAVERSKAARARQFEDDLKNSDPKTQKAILKSMKKFSSNPSDYRDLDQFIEEQVGQGASMVTLLEQISFAPTDRAVGGRSLMKVTKVKTGSVYEKAGISLGDIVRLGKAKGTAFGVSKPGMKFVGTKGPTQSEELKIYQKIKRKPTMIKQRLRPGLYSALDFRGQVLQKKELAIYKDFNLKVGDKIIMFNDRPLSTPQDAMSLYQGLKKRAVARLLVQRGDTFKLLTKTR